MPRDMCAKAARDMKHNRRSGMQHNRKSGMPRDMFEAQNAPQTSKISIQIKVQARGA